MINFEFHNPTRIIFGKGCESQAGTLTGQIGKKALLHYGGGSIKKTGLYDKIVGSLRESGVEFVELGGARPNPVLSLVREGIELCRAQGVDCILAVGGGSVIDSAKAIGVGVAMDGDIWPCFLDKREVTATIPVGVVLTIPAAGSESSIGCVITNEDGLYKRSINTPVIFPKFAIVNPELSLSLPPYQVGCGCTDIMAHLMERYFTNTPDVDVSDRMLEAVMRTVISVGPVTYNNPDNYGARAELCWAGTIAHNSLLDRGRVTEWTSHGIEHEISALYDIAHGAGLAITFPAWMKYVYKHNLPRFVQFAVRVMDVDLAYDDMEAIALEGIARLERFFTSVGMPTRFSHADIPSDRLREMAEKVVEHSGGTRGNLTLLDADDIERIYRLMI